MRIAARLLARWLRRLLLRGLPWCPLPELRPLRPPPVRPSPLFALLQTWWRRRYESVDERALARGMGVGGREAEERSDAR